MRLSGKKGFTLIELLIVVVIIGILAAIAIPKFANTKQKAYLASMKSDLRNLSTAEESYFADGQQYTTSKSAMNFTESKGNTVTVDAADGTGWKAHVTNTAVTTPASCSVAFGGQAPSTSEDGVITCN
jgi:type II secretion system protein G